MNGIANPAAVVTALRKIERHGWTADLLAAIGHAVPHRNDLERHPDSTLEVKRFARLAQSLLGGSLQSWEAAACEAILPETYCSVVLDAIDEFEQRADEAAAAASSSAKLARERRRQK